MRFKIASLISSTTPNWPSKPVRSFVGPGFLRADIICFRKSNSTVRIGVRLIIHLFSRALRSHDPPVAIEIFGNPNRTIRSCVDLEIDGSDDPRMAEKLMDILQHLLNLTPSSLSLKFWPTPDLKTRAHFPIFPSIERLRLEYVTLVNFHDLDDLLVKFPNLRELHMVRVRIRNFSSPYTGSYAVLSPRLRSLGFIRCIMDPLLHYFLGGRIVPTKYFSVDLHLLSDIPIVGEYFTMFGNALQDVEITFNAANCLGTRNLTLLCILTQFLQKGLIVVQTCNALLVCKAYLSRVCSPI